MDIIISFLVSCTASIIAYYVCNILNIFFQCVSADIMLFHQIDLFNTSINQISDIRKTPENQGFPRF